MITNKNINDYLHFGYIPELGNVNRIDEILKPSNSGPFSKEELENYNEDILIKKGIEVLREVFDDLMSVNNQKKHLVPLSGGLDSRLILAALMERVDPGNIEAITFGSPHSFDYEIPAKIIKNTNVSLERINCTKLNYSSENLKEAIRNGGRWTSIPDIYINQKALKLDQEYVRWSGFLGGELAGSYGDLNSNTLDNRKKFVEYQKRSKSFELTESSYKPENSLNPVNYSRGNLTEFEKLFLYNRSASGSLAIMFPENTRLNTPFLHPSWVNFILNVPIKYRKGDNLFHKILLTMYPDIMNLPTKNKAGLGLGNKSKIDYCFNFTKLKIRFELNRVIQSVSYPPIGVNYLDFKNAIKKLPSLRTTVSEACKNLEKRNVVHWLSPNEIFQDHLKGKKDNSKILLIFVGLELNLQHLEENN
ncbi:MAG: hypothetical protein ACQEWD_07980 [Bacteroidota bacterium]